MEDKPKTIKDLEDLCKKADQTRSIHGMIGDQFSRINKVMLLYVTIGSAILAMLIFASLSAPWVTVIGLFSASVFVVSLIPGVFNFDLKILERKMAVQAWGEWIREAKIFCDADTTKMTDSYIDSKQKELIESYKLVMERTPLIPNNKFNKYKRLHLQKIEISRALDKNPFKTICEIKKELLQSK